MDDSFGPRLFGHFDFTLLFEHSIFEIVPAGVICFVVPFYAFTILKGTPRVRFGLLLWAKLALAAALIGLQIANVAIWRTLPLQSRLADAAAAMSCVASVCIAILLYAGHVYFLHSPAFLSLFLTITMLFDTAVTRTYFNRHGLRTLALVHAPIPIVKLALVVLEEVSKRSLLRTEELRSELGHEAVAGFWNRSLFFWVNSMLLIGFRSNITQESLGDIGSQFDSDRLHADFCRVWEKGGTRRHTAKYALLLACLRTVPWLFILIIPSRVLYIGFSYAQPFLLQEVVKVISQEHPDPAVVNGLIGATALIFFGKGVVKGWYNHLKNQIMTSVRGVLVGAIYHKTLKLDADELANSVAVTLMSTDVNGVERLITLSYESWARLLEIASGIGILGKYIGPSCVFTLIPAIIAAICSTQLAKIMSVTRQRWNEKIEVRVAATSNVLAQMKDVKMMGLAPAMAKKLQEMQDAEVKASLRDRNALSGVFALSAFVETVTPAVVIASTIFWTRSGNGLSVELFFTTLAVVTMVTNPLAAVLGSISFWATGFASLSRIQQYLLKEELKDDREFDPEPSPDQQDAHATAIAPRGSARVRNRRTGRNSRVAVEMSHVSVTMDTSAPILREVSVKIPKKSKTMIFGRLGSGKSTMLKAILGEIKPRRGAIRLASRSIAYCDQIPWILNDTIQSNIIGVNQYDANLLRRVLWVCALDVDIAGLPDGIQTICGSNGRNLSGGQKQRIALARALYEQADMLLLDDVFSSLDKQTSSTIRVRLFGQTAMLNSTTLIMATNTAEHLVDANLVLGITKEGYVEEISNAGRDVSPSCIPESVLAERENIIPPQHPEHEKLEAPAVVSSDEQPTSVPERKYGDFSLYSYYLGPAGAKALFLWLLMIIIAAVGEKMPFIFVRLWLDRAPRNSLYYIGFAILSVANPVLNMFATSSFFYLVNPRASQSLHWKLADTMSRATMDFLSEEDAGALLNRFSQDMSLISQRLPLAILPASWMGLTVLMDIAIIASGASFAAPILPFFILFVAVIQHFYLRTSRQLRILELDTSKILYKHFTETTAGAAHIRAYRWQPEFTEEFYAILDETQKPFYCLYCVQQWLALTLDMATAVAAVSVVSLALKFTSQTSDTAMGLAFLSLITFSETTSLFIQTWVETETCLGGVARVRDFANNTPVEKERKPGPELPEDWPRYGKIDFNCVDAAYQANGAAPHTVLHSATLTVRPGEKVVITGRTGSGKTSLLLALLNLIKYSGSISIDDREIGIVPSDVLRCRVTTITQSTVQLKGSIRYNLNPFDPATLPRDFEMTDALMIGALNKVGLWNLIELRGGLDADMGKMELSQGQKQLMQLARAILHHQSVHSKVILVDEGSSSMDEETESKMNHVMTEVFARCTILLVSHRPAALGMADYALHLANGQLRILAHVDRAEEQVEIL